MLEQLNDLFKLFLSDLLYINSFISENFGTSQILLNKNQGQFLSRDYSIKNSRIKGYAFHGNGCLFQFKDFYIDVDLSLDRIGFTSENVLMYLRQKGGKIENNKIDEFLKLQLNYNNIYFDGNKYMLRC